MCEQRGALFMSTRTPALWKMLLAAAGGGELCVERKRHPDVPRQSAGSIDRHFAFAFAFVVAVRSLPRRH